MVSVTWYPVGGGTPIVFGEARPWIVNDLEGLDKVTSSAKLEQGPGQTGSTLLDVGLSSRVVTLTATLAARTPEEFWLARADLGRAVAVEPRRPGTQPALGNLRMDYPGQPTVELLCVPTGGPEYKMLGGTAAEVSIEFTAPDPRIQEIVDQAFALGSQAGGMKFPLTFPFSVGTYNAVAEIVNRGDVYAPILARIYGDLTDPRLINRTTGETVAITGNVPAGSYIQVYTGFGQKGLYLVNATTGAATSIMERLNLSMSTFWSLKPGLNTIELAAATNVSGSALVLYRPRYLSR